MRIVTRYREVVRDAPLHQAKSGLASDYKKLARTVTPNPNIRFSVAVVIDGGRKIRRETPLLCIHAATALDHIPDHDAIGSADHRKIGLSVTVIIAGNRFIAAYAPLSRTYGSVGAVDVVPGPGRITPNRNITLAVAVIVTGRRKVGVRHAPLLHDGAAPAFKTVRVLIARATDRIIRFTVMIYIHCFAQSKVCCSWSCWPRLCPYRRNQKNKQPSKQTKS